MPSSVFYVSAELFIFFGIIFLDKLVSVTAFKIEFIFGIFSDKFKIPFQSIGNIIVYRFFECPEPRCIKMRRGYCIYSRFFVVGIWR